jgi:hypothetical protein
MSTLTSTLLDFILSLLRDPQAAQAFNDHPEQALSDAGLNDVCSADVQSLMPMLADYAPAGVSPYHSSGVSPYHHENNYSEDNYPKQRDQGRDNYQHGPDHDGGYQAIEHIKYVQQNYSYHPTQVLDFSHSVWGDQYNVWADDSAVAINGGVAAGDDIKDSEIKAVNNSGDGSAVGFGTHVDNTDSFNHISNSGDGATVGIGNSPDYSGAFNQNSGDGAAVGYDNTTHDSGNSADDGGLAGSGEMNDSNNSADHGGNSGEDGTVDNSHTDVGPIDVGGVAIAGETATAGENNNVANDSAGVVQAGDDINHSLDDNFSPSDNFSDNFSHDFNGNEVETEHHQPHMDFDATQVAP